MSLITWSRRILLLNIIAMACLSNTAGNLSMERSVFNITCTTWDIWIPFEEEFLYNATSCNFNICPKNCECTLKKESFLTNCSDDIDSANIDFPVNVRTLYLGDIQLNSIKPFAFNGTARGWKQLWLNNNDLDDLEPGVFSGLRDLEFLTLYENKLVKLRYGVFTGLESLLEINLKNNLLVVLQPGIFQELTSLKKVAFEYNQIKELEGGVFCGLLYLEELDADRNRIENVSVNVFHGLNHLIELDLDGNMLSELETGIFNGLSNLEEIELDNNNLTAIPHDLFTELFEMKALSLSNNLIDKLDFNIFTDMLKLEELYLLNNNLRTLPESIYQNTPNLEILYMNKNMMETLSVGIFRNLTKLRILSLAEMHLSHLSIHIFNDLYALEFLNISRNNFNRISGEVFKKLSVLLVFDVTQNPLDWVNTNSFEFLAKSVTVFVDEYATCCFIKTARCSFTNTRSSFLSCKRLLPYSILRVVIWIVGIATIVANSIVLFKRFTQKNNAQTLLITNLSLSDLLSGIYLLILLSVDLHYKDFFPTHSESWRHSGLCKAAGALSLFSSETSVFLITLISIDRFISIKFPFSKAKMNNQSAKITVVFLWTVSGLISISSVLISVFKPKLYDASEICIGLPISRINLYKIIPKSFELASTSIEGDLNVAYILEAKFVGSKPSMYFSIAVFTVLNLLCFLIVAFCYASIFYTAKRASRVGGSSNKDREIRRAFKMAAIVISDFCCWLVVIILSILVQTKRVTINPEAYAWIATFVLPINSCMNPFLYTLSEVISKRIQRKIDDSTNNPVSNRPRQQIALGDQ